MASRIKTTEKMSNAGFHANGKPNWWVRTEGGTFLRIPDIRGDKHLDIVVDLPVGTTVYCGAGKGAHKTVRETIITIEAEGTK